MKGHIPSETIEEVKTRANIVDVVSEYVTLKKTGKNFTGCCPFHKEKNPSFTVNPDKQIFYCFGCQEGGNVVSFLMKISNMSFPESIRHLADKFGISIPEGPRGSGERQRASEKEQLIEINRMAAEFFSKYLSSVTGKGAREYLQERGVDTTVLAKFGLGYSPDGWRHLKDFFSGKKVPSALVEKAGLIIVKDNDRSYDRFRGRLMFPIADINGNIVAFGGRAIVGKEPKYINSPESPVYVKGKILYGLHRTKSDISRKGGVIIVEGYLDLLSLWAAGITNVVATLGTALTRDQINVIRRYTRNVYMIFDPDEAGRNAVERGLRLFLEEEMHAWVVVLPEGYDPDDYVRKFGRKALEDLIARSPSMVDYYIENLAGGEGTLEDRADSVKDSIAFIRNIKDPVERNLFIKQVSEKAGVDQGLLKDEVNRKRGISKKTTGRNVFPEQAGQRLDMVEMSLIHMIMEHPERIPAVMNAEILKYFLSNDLKTVGERLVAAYKSGEINTTSDIINEIGNSRIRERLLKLTMTGGTCSDDVLDKTLRDTIKKIRLKWCKTRRNMLQRKLIEAQKSGNVNLCDRLVMEKGKILEEEKMIKA